MSQTKKSIGADDDDDADADDAAADAEMKRSGSAERRTGVLLW